MFQFEKRANETETRGVRASADRNSYGFTREGKTGNDSCCGVCIFHRPPPPTRAPRRVGSTTLWDRT